MTATTVSTASPARTGRRISGPAFRALLGMHAKLLRREPAAAVMILLPLALLTIFGLIPGAKKPQPEYGGLSTLDVYVPTIAAMVPLMIACTGLPTVMATFRERNALRRFSVSPVPPAGMLAALVTVMSALTVAGVVLIVVLGTTVFGAHMPSNLGAVISSFVLGFTAVMAFGMIAAARATTSGMASAIGMPFMILNFFFSGLYVPVGQMPHLLQTIGEYVPFGAVMDSWSGHGPLWQHLAVLAGYTVLGSAVAARMFRWE